MKAIKDKKDTELEKLLLEKKQALRLFRFNFAGGKAKNTTEGRKTRQEIAQILTELNRRASAANV